MKRKTNHLVHSEGGPLIKPLPTTNPKKESALRDVVGFLRVVVVLYVAAATIYGTFCLVKMLQSVRVPSVSYEVTN